MAAFEALEADGSELQNFGDVVGGLKGVRVAEADQRAVLRAVDQLSLASRTVTQVPSVPTRARATWKPFSGRS